MSLLDILSPRVVPIGRGRPVHPMGPPEPEFVEAERVDRAVRRWAKRKKRGGGARIGNMTRMQIVHAAIVAQPGISPKAIGRATSMDPSPVYVALRQLKAKGFIESREARRVYPLTVHAPVDLRGDLGAENIAAWRARKSA